MILICGTAVLLLPRRHTAIPMLVIACFVAPAQRIVIATLDFNLLRIMVVFAWIRLMLLGDFKDLKWQMLDKIVVAWACVGTIIFVIQQGNFSAFVYKAGASFDAIGMYFFFRCVIRDLSDVDSLFRGIALLSIPVAIAFLLEKQTGRNMFSIFGGVPEITNVREGKLRARGAFAHAIIAGVFWAALLPMFVALGFRNATGKIFAIVSTITTLFIVIATASSTPIAGVAAGVVGGIAWPLRKYMKKTRWAIFGGLTFLHMVMNAPVWHLIGRVDLVGGSTGYHRYRLIDAAVNNFSKWALIGTQSTAGWGYHLFDVTNQYILEGVRGGLITMVLFIAQIVYAYSAIGRLRRSVMRNRADEAMAWGMGVSLFVHLSAFIAVSYFGQIIVIWYMLLGAACSLDPRTRRA